MVSWSQPDPALRAPSGWKKSSGEKWSSKEGDRQMVGSEEHYNGVVMHSGNNFGWVKPTDALPISVADKLAVIYQN